MNELLKNFSSETSESPPKVSAPVEPPKVKKGLVAYSEQLGDEICELVSSGNALYDVAKRGGYPSIATVLKWARTHVEFGQRLAQANDIYWELQMLRIFEDIAAPLKSSIGASNQISKLKLEWEAVRLMASKFSSKFSERPVRGIELQTADATVQVIDYGNSNP